MKDQGSSARAKLADEAQPSNAPTSGSDQGTAPFAARRGAVAAGAVKREKDQDDGSGSAQRAAGEPTAKAAPASAPRRATPPVYKPKAAQKPASGIEKAKAEEKEKAKPKEQEQKPVVVIRPVAGPARMKRRHWGLVASFLLVVIVPLVASALYLFTVAEDQYHSLTGFTVRSQEQSGANDLIGGLVQFAGGSTASDSDILYEFIQSQEMMQAVNEHIDLRAHYSRYWPRDWVFSIWPEASQEDLIWYWNRMVRVSYDTSTGLIEVQVKAFDPLTAQQIAQAIVAESQARINELNQQAREDAMRYAQDDLDEAVEKLKNAREALTSFRTRSQIVDPETDIQTRMGVMASLQQQLAEALVEYDLLRGTSSANDPRLREVSQRIDVIRDRIAIERRNFATSSTETGGVSQDYPSLIAEFERMTVDREYAEQAYKAALTAYETARDEANRNSRYLATYIKPTRAEASEYPQRFVLSGLIGLFLLLTWSIGALIYYSIRDRS